MDAWLSSARDALAREAGVGAERLDLSPEDEQTLLELARIAAYESGERTNAPLLCYLAGLAAGGGASLEALADAVRRSSS